MLDVIITCLGWLADVIAIVGDGIATLDWMTFIMPDIIAYLTDKMATGSTIYLILFYFKFWDVEKAIIPYVRQKVFAYLSV